MGNEEPELPKKHQITIFKKTNKRGITNHDEVVKFVKEKYGTMANVVATDPQALSRVEQINLMLNTTLFLVPCGAISFSALFLPPGATLIVTDFPGYQDKDVFTSDHMDSSVWSALWWINDVYYTINSAEEIEHPLNFTFPHPQTCPLKTKNNEAYRGYRAGRGVKIKFDKLSLLIDHAFFTMSN